MSHRVHVKFLKDLLKREATSLEFIFMSHLKTSVVYWSLMAAILLDALDEIYPKLEQERVLQYLKEVYKEDGGFAGNQGAHDSHILFTLSAIQIMKLLCSCAFPEWFNADLTVSYILALQDRQTGAFSGDSFGEVDSRFSYCAVASLSLLDRLGDLDAGLTAEFILNCRNFDGGFGAIPGSESHGGNIFCCISLLEILNNASQNIIIHKYVTPPQQQQLEQLFDWLAWRQLPGGGLNGRPEKLPDVCYSWWILSVLKSLNQMHRIDQEKLEEFILECQDLEGGGFADRPGDMCDVFHTLFGLTGLALLQKSKIQIDPLYCMPSIYI